MNILRAGNKSPMEKGFFKNSAGDLLPALRFLGGLYNFCNFVIVFSLIAFYVTLIFRRATYFRDSEMIEYYQKMCNWNSKSTKTKNDIRNYASTLKTH